MSGMTVFSLIPAEPPVLADPAQAAAALEAADYLSTDILALDEAAQGIAAAYFKHLEEGDLQAALMAKKRLGDIVRGTPPERWRQRLARAQATLRSPVSRFASFAANIGYISQILATDETARESSRRLQAMAQATDA